MIIATENEGTFQAFSIPSKLTTLNLLLRNANMSCQKNPSLPKHFVTVPTTVICDLKFKPYHV